MRRMALLLLIAALETGCTNVVRSGLLSSNSIFLQPSADHRIYLQIRNTSENHQVTLSDLPARLTSKGYDMVKDPEQAGYWLQTRIVYCHQAKAGVTPQQVVGGGFGAGIGTGGAALSDANPFMGTGENELAGMMPPGMGNARGTMVSPGSPMPDLNAMMARAMSQASARGGYPGGMQASQEGVYYLCAVDVQITERTKEGASPAPDPQPERISSNPRVHRMRMVGHVLQKNLNMQEATPILQEKLSTGLAGLF